MTGSLRGVRVVDITMSVAGPFTTQILGDLGADVIKVERPPAGDDTRRWGPPFWGPDSPSFLGLNRNKRSLLLDLKDEDDKATLTRLLDEADVLVQNMRPGTLERLGFGYEAIRARNPRLVYCEITGYGPTGPLKDRPAYDPLMQAFSGLMSLTGEEGRAPARIPASILDQGTAMWTVIGILDALRRRDETGQGRLVQTSLLETALTWLPPQFLGYFADGTVPPRLGSGTVGIAPYQAFPAADGWFIIAAGNDSLWHRLCQAIDRADLLAGSRFTHNPDRVARRAELADELSATTRKKEAAHWMSALTDAGVPTAPIQTIDQVVAHEQVQALGAFVPVRHPVIEDLRVIATPIRVDGAYYPVRTPPPALGEGTGEEISRPERDSEGGT
jgi:crotonobetainyl-CoA:carnitine CoA-transferase CaiB-like acyl-CoA transferase